MTKRNTSDDELFWEDYTPIIKAANKYLENSLEWEAIPICDKFVMKFLKEHPEAKKKLKQIGVLPDELSDYLTRASRHHLSKAFGKGLPE